MPLVKRIASFLTAPVIFLHILLLFQWGLFLTTTLHPYTVASPGRTYVYLRGHLVYTSLIRQAKDGAWTTYVPHSTRPSPADALHVFFITLGKIAAVFNIDPPMMYMASRMAAAIILFWSTYFLITLWLPKPLHTLAILFTLGLEPGPMLSTLSSNVGAWSAAIFSYYPQVVSYRHFGLPHHTMGEACGLLFIGMFYLCVQKPTIRRYILLALLGIIGTRILPPYFVIISIAVFAPWTIYALFTKTFKQFRIPLLIAALSIGSMTFMVRMITSQGYASKDFNLDEKRWVTNSGALISYVSTLLFYIPGIAIVWAGVIKLWRSWPPTTRLVVILSSSWVLIPALLVPVTSFSWFPLANFRLMDGYNYLPAGLLMTLGIASLGSLIPNRSIQSFLKGFLLTAIVGGSLFLTNLYTSQTLTDQNNQWSNVYLGNGHWKAFEFLKTVPKGAGIMVMNHFGEIIPEFAPVKSFLGSTPGFSDWPERYYIAGAFYSGEMTDEQAVNTLITEHISYVYYSDEEKYYNKTGTLYPNVLTPIFDQAGVTIYKIK